MGHDVTVVTSNSVAQDDVPGISRKGITTRYSLPDLPSFEINDDGVKIYRFKPKMAFYTALFTPGLARYLFQHIEDSDIVHVHGYLHAEPSIVTLIAKAKRKPFVLTAHDLIASYGGFSAAFKRLADIGFGRSVIRSAAALIALAPLNREEYLSLGARDEQIRIVPNGITREDFENLQVSTEILNDLNNPDHFVLFVGRLTQYKGAQYIIEAIKDIIEQYPVTKFVFIGQDDGYRTQLMRLAAADGVSDACIFAGQVSDEKLLQFYASADVFVLPSTCEAFGMAALESIAAGTPVVLANSGGLSYILSEFGGYPLDMSADVSTQIARAVKAVFRNGARNRIEAERKKALDEYSWNNVASRLTKVYEGVLSR
jgi:glycosyltransferase involved in cell wall biosynthesis